MTETAEGQKRGWGSTVSFEARRAIDSCESDRLRPHALSAMEMFLHVQSCTSMFRQLLVRGLSVQLDRVKLGCIRLWYDHCSTLVQCLF